jgi:hypothetical protein
MLERLRRRPSRQIEAAAEAIVPAPTPVKESRTLGGSGCLRFSFVYEHADELGAYRLGTGPRARLRFDFDEPTSNLLLG